MKKESDYLNLYKKVDATSKTRFHSSRRLRIHTKLSTFTIVFISLGLILTSLMQAYDLGENISSKTLPLFQVFASIAVLVYSLLIDKNDFSSLSEKMYACASRLGELKQKIYPHLENGTLEKYESFKDEYHEILKLYETAAINDFRADYFRAQLDMPENYPFTKPERFFLGAKVFGLYLLDFLQYFFISSVLCAAILWLWGVWPFVANQ